MEKLIDIKGRFYFVEISRNDKLLAGAKASSVTVFDLETSSKTAEFNMKNCANIYFSLNNKYVILVNTSSLLWIINLTDYEIIFKKKIGNGDCYKVSEYNNNILVGDWNNNHLMINLQDFSYQKLNLNFGKLFFVSYYNEKKLVALQQDEFNDFLKIIAINLQTLESYTIKEINVMAAICFQVYKDKIVFVEMEGFSCYLVILDLDGDIIEKKELDFPPVLNLVAGEYICASQFFKAEVFDSHLNTLKKVESNNFSTTICFANFHSENKYLISQENKFFICN